MRRMPAAIIMGFSILTLAAKGPAMAGDDAAAVPPPESVTAHWDLLNNSCTECHNYMDWAGEIAFDTMTPEGVPANAEIWEAAIRKLRGGLMPPPGKPRPPEAEIDAFAASLEAYLNKASARKAEPGRVGLHRLNRKEYANAVRDLLGVEIDAAALLPPDDESDGFDNVASVLQVSATFLDQYLTAARQVSIRAVGQSNPGASRKVYQADRENQNVHIEGLPLGTRGGMRVTHYFPADGEYEFNIGDLTNGGYVTALEDRHRLIMTIDGERAFAADLGGRADMRAVLQKQTPAIKAINRRFKDIRVDVSAGEHTVGVTFIARSLAESNERLEPFDPVGGVTRIPRIRRLEILGPNNPTGLSPTASRDKIFICYPEAKRDARPCAEDIISALARRAYRRPVTDRDMAPVMDFYESGAKAGGFEKGIQKALMAVLASPKFLYRGVAPPENLAAGGVYEISDLELASRLSFFLWSSIPDDTLIDLAVAGKLDDPAVLRQQVERMLADPRARSLTTNFGLQWLDVDDLAGLEPPDPNRYPNFDTDLRAAFRQEMVLFLDSVLRRDQSVLELLSADYTFVNERLAQHYDIPGVIGDRFRRVALRDERRWGLLGKGAVLLTSSYPHRTSPVLRGAWVMETIIGAPPAAPPPGVETDIDMDASETEAKTVRARLEEHRAKPSCNMCHGVIDPLGLALENFNAIGGWRDTDVNTGTAIDAGGRLARGRKVSGPADLRKALLARPERFVQTFTEKLMTFALGRTVEYYDMPAVRRIVDEAKERDYRFSSIVMGIVTSNPFQKARAPGAADTAATQEAALAQ